MFPECPTSVRKVSNNLWEGLPETSLICFEHVLDTLEHFPKSKLLPETMLLYTCLTPGGARGHYGDTLGESPRLKLVCDFYIIVLASVQHPNLCVSEGQRFVFSIES